VLVLRGHANSMVSQRLEEESNYLICLDFERNDFRSLDVSDVKNPERVRCAYPSLVLVQDVHGDSRKERILTHDVVAQNVPNNNLFKKFGAHSADLRDLVS
jgi:hypothetical protein